jgi:hypothetical protein
VEDKRDPGVAVSSFFALNVDGPLERETFRGFVGGKLDSRKEFSSFLVNKVNEGALPTEERGATEVAVDLYVLVG